MEYDVGEQLGRVGQNGAHWIVSLLLEKEDNRTPHISCLLADNSLINDNQLSNAGIWCILEITRYRLQTRFPSGRKTGGASVRSWLIETFKSVFRIRSHKFRTLLLLVTVMEYNSVIRLSDTVISYLGPHAPNRDGLIVSCVIRLLWPPQFHLIAANDVRSVSYALSAPIGYGDFIGYGPFDQSVNRRLTMASVVAYASLLGYCTFRRVVIRLGTYSLS
ncbi:hypothetical protein F4861DRAFT_502315 [Xylaria intraflava]|nr:hypothetical protein F4861DRAFT_502315 [Xylaria intraflava]